MSYGNTQEGHVGDYLRALGDPTGIAVIRIEDVDRNGCWAVPFYSITASAQGGSHSVRTHEKGLVEKVDQACQERGFATRVIDNSRKTSH